MRELLIDEISVPENPNPYTIISKAEKTPHGQVLTETFITLGDGTLQIAKKALGLEVLTGSLDEASIRMGIVIHPSEIGVFRGTICRLPYPIQGTSLEVFDTPDAVNLPVQPLLVVSTAVIREKSAELGFIIAQKKPPSNQRISQLLRKITGNIVQSGVPTFRQAAVA